MVLYFDISDIRKRSRQIESNSDTDEWAEKVGVEPKNSLVSEQYDYYIFELCSLKGPVWEALDQYVSREPIPEGVSYYTVAEDALSWLTQWYQLDKYDSGEPFLVVTDRPPREYEGEPLIIFKLGNAEPSDVPDIVRLICYHLNQDEFERLQWEERKQRYQDRLSTLFTRGSKAATIVNLIVP